MEALEAFGGSDFGSVLRKGESFGEKLEKDKESRRNMPDQPPSKKKRFDINVVCTCSCRYYYCTLTIVCLC